jgi:hypothetical protein
MNISMNKDITFFDNSGFEIFNFQQTSIIDSQGGDTCRSKRLTIISSLRNNYGKEGVFLKEQEESSIYCGTRLTVIVCLKISIFKT